MEMQICINLICLLFYVWLRRKMFTNEARDEKMMTRNKIYEKAFMNNLQTYIEFQKLSIYISLNKTSFLPFDFSLKRKNTVFKSYFLKCPCSYQLRGNLCTTDCLYSDIHLVFVLRTTLHIWRLFIFDKTSTFC